MSCAERGGARRALWLVLFGLAGCIPWPHFESDQHAASGVVVRGGAPVAGAVVQTCSYSSWHEAPTDPADCLVHDVLTTGPDGAFRIPERHHFEWVIFGEAELPVTIVSACSPDHSELAAAKLGYAAKPGADWSLPLAPKAQAKPILVGEGRASPEGVVAYALARCE